MSTGRGNLDLIIPNTDCLSLSTKMFLEEDGEFFTTSLLMEVEGF